MKLPCLPPVVQAPKYSYIKDLPINYFFANSFRFALLCAPPTAIRSFLPPHRYRFRVMLPPPPTTFILLFLLCCGAELVLCHDERHHPLHAARAACSSSYTSCNPKGAATTNEPPVGTALSPLYVDVVDTLDSANLAKRDAEERARALIESRASGGSLCCNYLTWRP